MLRTSVCTAILASALTAASLAGATTSPRAQDSTSSILETPHIDRFGDESINTIVDYAFGLVVDMDKPTPRPVPKPRTGRANCPEMPEGQVSMCDYGFNVWQDTSSARLPPAWAEDDRRAGLRAPWTYSYNGAAFDATPLEDGTVRVCPHGEPRECVIANPIETQDRG